MALVRQGRDRPAFRISRSVLWLALSVFPAGLTAQAPARVNIYRYVLDVDIPESAGLIALDATPSHVLKGSAPKPIMGSLVHLVTGDGQATGGAVDIVPYYLLGGGIRELRSYRSSSVAGRLTRVVTKTTASLALLRPDDGTGDLLGAAGLRTTFHDPHDPVLNSPLPEEVDSLLAAAGVPEPPITVEDFANTGVDLTRAFEHARTRMRARGDVQVSAGWGMAGRLGSGSLAGDSLGHFAHTVWITGQHAFGDRLDLLVTAQLRHAFRHGKGRLGLGIQRKAHRTDFRFELYYDGADQRLHPGMSAEVSAGHGLGGTIGLVSDAPLGGGRGRDRTRVQLGLRWYTASQR
jgi:hypothetical protein